MRPQIDGLSKRPVLVQARRRPRVARMLGGILARGILRRGRLWGRWLRRRWLRRRRL